MSNGFTLPGRTADSFGRDLREMTERHLTFADGAFRRMAKQRLKMVRDDVYAQLARLLVEVSTDSASLVHRSHRRANDSGQFEAVASWIRIGL